MNLPIKCGDMYIKFNNNGKPQYGFKVNKRNEVIQEFINLTDNTPKIIILPSLEPNFAVHPKGNHLRMIGKFNPYREYINGNIRINPQAFKGIAEATIVVPNDTSIMLDWGAFDDGANIDFILPKNMGIKQIFRAFSGVIAYEHENWTLLADRDLQVDIDTYSSSYDCMDYTPNMNKNVRFSINPDFYVENGEIASKEQIIEDDFSI